MKIIFRFEKISLTCSKSKPMMAFCKYLTPPCINLVLRLLVPDEKSYFSTRAVFKPRLAFINLIENFYVVFEKNKTPTL